MNRLIQLCVGGALTVVLAVPVFSVTGLLDVDQRRLDEAKQRHAEQLASAASVYHASVERANGILERQYLRMIETYERRGETETATALQTELEQLKESASAAAPETPEIAAAAEPGHVELIRAIGPSLVAANGQTGSSRMLADKDYVLLYFSAGWCPPCRAFTPRLVEFRNEHGRNGNFEVVFVSSDRQSRDMHKYMNDYDMSFPAVPFARIDASQLKNAYGGRGIPNLVIVDREGKVVSGSYVDGRYVGPNKVLNDMQALLQ